MTSNASHVRPDGTVFPPVTPDPPYPPGYEAPEVLDPTSPEPGGPEGDPSDDR